MEDDVVAIANGDYFKSEARESSLGGLSRLLSKDHIFGSFGVS